MTMTNLLGIAVNSFRLRQEVANSSTQSLVVLSHLALSLDLVLCPDLVLPTSLAFLNLARSSNLVCLSFWSSQVNPCGYRDLDFFWTAAGSLMYFMTQLCILRFVHAEISRFREHAHEVCLVLYLGPRCREIVLIPYSSWCTVYQRVEAYQHCRRALENDWRNLVTANRASPPRFRRTRPACIITTYYSMRE
jgi:hypothetical protein